MTASFGRSARNPRDNLWASAAAPLRFQQTPCCRVGHCTARNGSLSLLYLLQRFGSRRCTLLRVSSSVWAPLLLICRPVCGRISITRQLYRRLDERTTQPENFPRRYV